MNETPQITPTLDSLSELRVKVAELLGWTIVVHNPKGMMGEHEKFPCAVGLPNWPRDLNACAELIDLLADRGWTCRLDNGLDKTWECTFETGTSGHMDYMEHYVPADTLAVAICHAFVAVMEGRK